MLPGVSLSRVLTSSTGRITQAMTYRGSPFRTGSDRIRSNRRFRALGEAGAREPRLSRACATPAMRQSIGRVRSRL